MNFIAMAFLISCTSLASEFRLNDFLKLLKDNDVQSVDQAVPLLPEHLRKNFVLMADSKSVQKATSLNPRAILFGTDGRFVISFNGDSTLPGYNSLEMYQVNAETAEFEFYRLNFPLRKNSKGEIVPPVKNPHMCMHCHQGNIRPIWNAYPHWTGAYGNKNDLLTEDEKTLYKDYLKNRETHARYSKLIHRDNYEFAPFRRDASQKNYTARPGTRMGQYAIRLNAVRLAKQVRAANKPEKIPLLVYAMNSCTSPQQPLSDAAVLDLFGLHVDDFDLTTMEEPSVGLDYQDGTVIGDSRMFLLGLLLPEYLENRPALREQVMWYPQSGYGVDLLLKVPEDYEHAKTLDSIAISARFKRKACPDLLKEIK